MFVVNYDFDDNFEIQVSLRVESHMLLTSSVFVGFWTIMDSTVYTPVHVRAPATLGTPARPDLFRTEPRQPVSKKPEKKTESPSPATALVAVTSQESTEYSKIPVPSTNFSDSPSTTAIVPRKGPSMPKPSWHRPWKLSRVISGHTGCVRCLAIDSVSNDWFASGSNDRMIKINAIAFLSPSLEELAGVACTGYAFNKTCFREFVFRSKVVIEFSRTSSVFIMTSLDLLYKHSS